MGRRAVAAMTFRGPRQPMRRPMACRRGVRIETLVDPPWRGRGIATALTRARLRWAFARTDTVFYVAGADNAASLHLHAALGFQEVTRFDSDRSAAGMDVLSQLVRSPEPSGPGPLEAQGRRVS
jgi:GNAT superfamily N-acetyltransferase